jgi:hypothetical protein
MPRKNPDHVSAGEVIVVSKELVPQAKPVVEISHSAAEKLRPKRPLSEKQKENLAKLIAKNKEKAAAWKAGKSSTEAPPMDTIPEDQVAIQVKPKRAYNRKVPHYTSPAAAEITENVKKAKAKAAEWDPQGESVEPPSQRYVMGSDEEDEPPKRAKPKRRARKEESDEESEVDARPRRRIVSDTSDFDSDDDVKVTKYVTKTNQRLQAVKQIEQQIAQRMNPYAARGISIF